MCLCQFLIKIELTIFLVGSDGGILQSERKGRNSIVGTGPIEICCTCRDLNAVAGNQ